MLAGLNGFGQRDFDFNKTRLLMIDVKFMDTDSIPLKNFLVKHDGIFYQTNNEGIIKHKSRILTNFPFSDQTDYNDSLRNRKFKHILEYIDADQTYYYNQSKLVHNIDELQMLISNKRKYSYTLIIKE